MTIKLWILVLLSMLMPTIVAHAATPDVSITPASGGTWSASPAPGGRINITLTRLANVPGTVDFLLTGSTADRFNSVTVVTSDAAHPTTVHIRGVTPLSNTGTVESITKTGTGEVNLRELRLAGHLGATLLGQTCVSVDSIEDFIVGGIVYGDILCVNTSFSKNSQVVGPFAGNLTITRGSLKSLAITTSIGSFFGDHPTVNVSGDIANLTAYFFHCDIIAGGSIDTLQVADKGLFQGSVAAQSINPVPAGPAGGLMLGNWSDATVHIAGDVSLPIRAGTSDSSSSITIGGDVSTSITILDHLSGAIHIAGSLTPAATILVDGNLQGSLEIGGSVPAGALVDIQQSITHAGARLVILGDLGGQITIGRPPDFGGNIDDGALVRVASNVDGAIRVRMKTTRGGDAKGSVAGLVRVDNTLSGLISVDRILHASGSLHVGGSHMLPSTHLRGQVIVNASNTQSPWQGAMYVSNQYITEAPNYNLPSEQLGGGAAGLAPFNLYPADCVPPNNGYLTAAQFQAGGALLRYYGPVLTGTGPPPIVEVRDPYNENSWQPLPLGFTVDINPPVAGRHRTIRARYTGTAGLLSPGRYRIHLDEGSLVSARVAGAPDVMGGDYFFNIVFDCDKNGPDAGDLLSGAHNPAIDCDRNGVLDTCDIAARPGRDSNKDNILDTCQVPCPCDWNSDTETNSQDFFDFLTDYFKLSADYNNDGLTNSQDFFDFLYCIFGAC